MTHDKNDANRGYNSALARIDQDGIDAALAWIARRQADTSRSPLPDAYERAYLAECEREIARNTSRR